MTIVGDLTPQDLTPQTETGDHIGELVDAKADMRIACASRRASRRPPSHRSSRRLLASAIAVSSTSSSPVRSSDTRSAANTLRAPEHDAL